MALNSYGGAEVNYQVQSPDMKAALSEGFCLRCKVLLNPPVVGTDATLNGAEFVFTAATCPKCRAIYVLDRQRKS